MRNKMMATGLAIGAGLAVNAASALAGSGGVPAESPASPMGGIPAETANLATGQASEATPQQQKRLLQQAIEDPDTYFTALPLFAPDPGIIVENEQFSGEEMVNPLTIEYGGKLAAYAAVTGEGGKQHIEMLAADKATVMEYIGNRAVTVHDPQRFIVERTLHFNDAPGDYPHDFTDGRDSFGAMP